MFIIYVITFIIVYLVFLTMLDCLDECLYDDYTNYVKQLKADINKS